MLVIKALQDLFSKWTIKEPEISAESQLGESETVGNAFLVGFERIVASRSSELPMQCSDDSPMSNSKGPSTVALKAPTGTIVKKPENQLDLYAKPIKVLGGKTYYIPKKRQEFEDNEISKANSCFQQIIENLNKQGHLQDAQWWTELKMWDPREPREKEKLSPIEEKNENQDKK